MKLWDPTQYLTHGDARLRPALELLARIDMDAPSLVVDGGCGPGNVTPFITGRWPQARYIGVDSSLDMLDDATSSCPGLEWCHADLATWLPDTPIDVLYSNATLHWLDDHPRLFPRLIEMLRPGGVLAVQMPHNHAAPTHTEITEVVESGEWADHLRPIQRRFPVGDTDEYYSILRPVTTTLDIWETEYLHVLDGKDAAVEWTKGSVLRPLLAALDEPQRGEFLTAYAERMRYAYPRRSDGTTLMPFKRLFVVARV